MSPDFVRLECLRLANIGGDKTVVVERARAYADFVLGNAPLVVAVKIAVSAETPSWVPPAVR